MTPKNLLRYPDCKSPLAEFDEVPDDHGIVGVRFKRLIMDEAARDRCVRLPALLPTPRLRFARPKTRQLREDSVPKALGGHVLGTVQRMFQAHGCRRCHAHCDSVADWQQSRRQAAGAGAGVPTHLWRAG